MSKRTEQYQDIIDNCDALLNGILSEFTQTDNTPQGRMITQCQWLKERAQNNDLQLPLENGELDSLLYIYTNGEMYNIDRTIKDAIMNQYSKVEVETAMTRLVALTYEADLLIKHAYYPYALRYIEALIDLLVNASRPLKDFEQNAIPELQQLRSLLANGEIEPPLISYLPDYPNFNQVDMYRASVEDMPNGKELTKATADLIFNGVRPDTWLTPEDADRETRNLIAGY